MFRNRKIVRSLSLLLLFVMMSVVVPYHQIFHKHSSKNTEHNELTQVSSFEKSCCKPTTFFHKSQAILPVYEIGFFPSVNLLKVQAYSSIVIKLLYNLSNKAPPVSIV